MNIVFHAQPSSAYPLVTWETGRYTAPWRDEAVLAALPAGSWDGPVVRLVRYEAETPEHHATLVLQRAQYFDYIGTNLSPSDCERTDALGISALLFTADGKFILQRRAPDLAICPGLLGPSMSGAVEPGDFKDATDLSQLDARREIREELGVINAEIPDLRLMGLIRNPQRAGSPELMYRGTLSLTAKALSTRCCTEGSLLFVDGREVYSLPDRTASIDNLMSLLSREDMSH
ncbi:MAG: hypothetical protein P8R54_30670 [Myxococcota bacterium]|nr:hypothetical protein [Myxococcota bacterium]